MNAMMVAFTMRQRMLGIVRRACPEELPGFEEKIAPARVPVAHRRRKRANTAPSSGRVAVLENDVPRIPALNRQTG